MLTADYSLLYTSPMAHLVELPDTGIVKLRRGGIQVTAVEPGSLAEAVGIGVGDRLLRVGDKRLRDVIDWRFYAGGEDLSQESPDAPLPGPVARGEQSLMIVGAIAGG